MFDHVTIGVSDRDASEAFYRDVLATLGYTETGRDDEFIEFGDFSIARAGAQRAVTRGLHVGFAAANRDHVKAFWRAGVGAGHHDDGAPGPRPQYGADYYGAFLRDPDGNSAEAVCHDRLRVGGCVDHLWIRVADRAASRRFYATIAPHGGFSEAAHLSDRTRFSRHDERGCFSIVDGIPTTPFHLAFEAPDRATVERFHAAALAAGYRDNGAPGERPQYHPGYFGAFVLDPDGHNVEVVDHGR